MPKGFGRRYWLQLIYTDAREEWLSWSGSYQSALRACWVKMHNDAIDYILILDGKLKQGEVAERRHILGDVVREAGKGRRHLSFEKRSA